MGCQVKGGAQSCQSGSSQQVESGGVRSYRVGSEGAQHPQAQAATVQEREGEEEGPQVGHEYVPPSGQGDWGHPQVPKHQWRAVEEVPWEQGVPPTAAGGDPQESGGWGEEVGGGEGQKIHRIQTTPAHGKGKKNPEK